MPNGEREWILDRVVGLTDGADQIEPAYVEEIDNSFNTWSALKLIVHSATINMYTKVISKHFDDFFYIDALAGSGLSEYGEGECFFGSPIIAAKHAAEPFTKMYFIDDDPEKCDLLEQRLENIFNNPEMDIQEPGDWEVLQGNSNDLVYDIYDDIWEVRKGKFNTLTFADNQAMDFGWDAMEKLSELTGDYLINYPGAMAVGMNMNNKLAHEGKMKEFFGRNLWDLGLSTRREYKQEYMKQMESLFDTDSHQVAVKVRSGTKSFEYDMIYATRDTAGGSGYIQAIEYIKEFVENVDGADVEDMLKMMHGDQTIIDSYLPEDRDIDNELLDGDDNYQDKNQSGLGDFV